MPAKAKQDAMPAMLPDIPYLYLTDRSQWSDLKRALNNCGLSWNIPDWMYTVVHGGEDYLAMRKSSPEAKAELDAIFAPPTIKVGEQDFKVNETSKEVHTNAWYISISG